MIAQPLALVRYCRGRSREHSHSGYLDNRSETYGQELALSKITLKRLARCSPHLLHRWRVHSRHLRQPSSASRQALSIIGTRVTEEHYNCSTGIPARMFGNSAHPKLSLEMSSKTGRIRFLVDPDDHLSKRRSRSHRREGFLKLLECKNFSNDRYKRFFRSTKQKVYRLTFHAHRAHACRSVPDQHLAAPPFREKAKRLNNAGSKPTTGAFHSTQSTGMPHA